MGEWQAESKRIAAIELQLISLERPISSPNGRINDGGSGGGTRVNVRRYAVYQGSDLPTRHTGGQIPEQTGEQTGEQLEKNIRKKEVKKENIKRKKFFSKREETLPEYYNAEPIRNPNPQPATPEEIEKVKKQIQKGKGKNDRT